ncbi:hypothetical protein AB0J28_11640 [Streptosporangium canum]|uniref:hypothetical protein n=1 Tax=Streptosporangium canum TaxID=324952 RepID=UPI00341CB8D0
MLSHDQRLGPRGRSGQGDPSARPDPRRRPHRGRAPPHRLPATEATITIGISGLDAAARIGRLHAVLGPLTAKHGWDFSEVPTDNGEG